MNTPRFATLLAAYALAHPDRELSTVTFAELADWATKTK
jgi:hypothetical protein